jgi:hypothetical protein
MKDKKYEDKIPNRKPTKRNLLKPFKNNKIIFKDYLFLSLNKIYLNK